MKSNTPCFSTTIKSALKRLSEAGGQRFTTIFKHGSLLVEVYAPRGRDPQQTHTHDEIYFVASGTGEYVCGDSRQTFAPTDLLFAAAGVEHRFENFTDDLTVWVISMARKVAKKREASDAAA
jgi:mannose-6-phosphate isomerase-like protein (cupin superfamily)